MSGTDTMQPDPRETNGGAHTDAVADRGPETGVSGFWSLLNKEIGRLPPRDWWERRSVRRTLDASGLPRDVEGTIRLIVTRSRLWRREKLDVARELIAHARDGLEAGTEPAELVAAMGDPKDVARLIRRAMKRKRHWLWHTRVWFFRVAAVTAGVVLMATGVMTARVFLGDPKPTRNFIAEMNEPFADYGADERSWPELRDVFVAIRTAEEAARREMQKRANDRADSGTLTDEQYALKFDTAGLDLRHPIDERHPDYPEMVEMTRRLGPVLEHARELGTRPVVGMPYSTRWPDDTDWSAMPPGWIDDPLPETDDVAEQRTVIGVMLPWLWPIRRVCDWLALDARVAAEEGDAERSLANIVSILGFAEQVDRDEILISNLVALACVETARQALGRVALEHPGLLERDHLVGLAHRFGRVRGLFTEISLTWEINMFEDVLQRAYTDDGNGDGHLTNEGIELLRALVDLPDFSDRPVEGVVGATSSILLTSRAEQRRVYMHGLALLRRDESAGYEIFRGRPVESDRWVEERYEDAAFEPVAGLFPAFGRAVANQAIGRARIDGTLVAIAAMLHRRDAGDWPAGVTELVPRYLPAAPEDPFTGGTMRLRVRDDGQLVVYCVGRDGDDDGGRMDPSKETLYQPSPRPRSIEDGDWVLFPTE